MPRSMSAIRQQDNRIKRNPFFYENVVTATRYEAFHVAGRLRYG